MSVKARTTTGECASRLARANDVALPRPSNSPGSGSKGNFRQWGRSQRPPTLRKGGGKKFNKKANEAR